jgi:hypothetical protein
MPVKQGLLSPDLKENSSEFLHRTYCLWSLLCDYSLPAKSALVSLKSPNPNPCGWGRIWLPKLWRGITLQWLKEWASKFVYSSNNVSWVYLVKYFWAKNGVFDKLFAKTCAKPPFFCRFHTFRAAWKAYLTSITLSTTTPGPGTPPARSRRTKQFWSRPHGL